MKSKNVLIVFAFLLTFSTYAQRIRKSSTQKIIKTETKWIYQTYQMKP